jgi:CelD/BcsL family acetyltransferase involved in cellulose biosynthesis
MLHTTGWTRTQDLHRLRGEWRELADQCPDATAFQTYEWLAAWWEHFGKKNLGNRLLLVAVRDERETLVGLAPLMTSFWHAAPLRRLTFLGRGVTDYHDVLALPEQEAAVCDAVHAYLCKEAFWQVGDLPQLREESVLRRNPPRPESGLAFRDFAGEPCPYLCLPQGGEGADAWDALLGRYGKKFRGNIRYYDRALDKSYSVAREVLTDEKSLESALDALFDLHQRRWNDRWLPGVMGGGRMRRFYRSVARAFLKRDWLRLHTISLDGEIVAVLFCIAYKDRTAYYQGGFEPTLAKLSLGSVVTGHAVRKALDERRTEFDFLRGDEPYKKRWTGGAARVNRSWRSGRRRRRRNFAWNFVSRSGCTTMARAVKEAPEEGRAKKKKTGVGTVLNRLLIVCLLGGCAYLYGQTVHLEDELSATQAQVAAARQAPSANAVIAKKPASARPKVDDLAQAQMHTRNAEQAIASGNLGDAWRESRAATVAAHAASLQASAETQKTLTEIKSRLDTVRGRATRLWRKVGG